MTVAQNQVNAHCGAFMQKYATPSSVNNMSLRCVAIKYSAWQFRFQSGRLKSKICTDVPKIWINHADYKNDYVKQTSKNLLKSFVKDLNTNLIIFGEANFQFSLALAAIHQSWQGVVSTHLEELSKENPRPLFNDIKEECIHFCYKNGQRLDIEPAIIHKYVAAIEKVQPPPQDNWIFWN